MNLIQHIGNGIIYEDSHSAHIAVSTRASHHMTGIPWRLRIEDKSHHINAELRNQLYITRFTHSTNLYKHFLYYFNCLINS